MVISHKHVAASMLLVAIACGKEKPAPTPDESDLRGQMLIDVVAKVVEPAHEDALTKARALASAAEAHVAGDASLDEVRAAWKDAMLSWQRVEVYRLGPAGAEGLDVGGADLRDDVYSWPTRNACRVDQELVEKTYEDAAALEAEAVNVRGLAAIEYLLYHTEPTNQCDPARSINQDGSWAALGDAEVARRRAAYVVAAARGVVKAIERLQAAWRDGFADEFRGAGSDGKLFSSRQEAINTYSNALMYLEVHTKDLKLGRVGGIQNCAQTTCPEAREFIWTDLNFDAVAANMDGFVVGFTGRDGVGFDDLLEELGQGELAAEMVAAANDARDAALAAKPMVASLQDGPEETAAVYAATKRLTDLLKTQFISVLDLELPQQAEGDND